MSCKLSFVLCRDTYNVSKHMNDLASLQYYCIACLQYLQFKEFIIAVANILLCPWHMS